MMRVTLLKLERRADPPIGRLQPGERRRFSLGKKGGMDEEKRGEEGET